MTPQELAADLRTRINPAYAAQLGTESYERRLCAEAIELLVDELDLMQHANTDLQAWFDAASTDLEKAQAELAALKSQEPVYGRYHAKIGMGESAEGYTYCHTPAHMDAWSAQQGATWEPLYLAAGAQQPGYQLAAERTGVQEQDKCWCDEQGIGAPGVSCGDCPRDYKQAGAQPPSHDYLAESYQQGHAAGMKAEAQERKPLTDQQMDAAIKSAKKVPTTYAGWVKDQRREFGRAIEAAHGITGEQP